MSIVCPKCRSKNLIKRGKRKTKVSIKQRYMCSDCGKRFVKDDGFKRMRHKPEIISRAIHMHQDGLSLFQVQYHLWQHDGIKVSRWAIAKWEKKYSLFLKSGKFASKSNYQRKNSYG